MKNERHLIVLSVIICQLFYSVALTSCSDDETSDSTPVLKGKITSYNEFGAAMLDFTEADMTNAGFSLGDVISITIDDKTEIVMPTMTASTPAMANSYA